MDKKYQVFISSTYDDLKVERSIVAQSILSLDCIPSGMEYFPAIDDQQWNYIKQLIDQCDYYIVIVGGKYGSLTDCGLSYTHREYEYAKNNNKPIIAFIYGEIDNLPKDKKESDPRKIANLNDFIGCLSNKLYKRWKNKDELESCVVTSVVNLIKCTPAIGWIRANTQTEEHGKIAVQLNFAKDELIDLRNKTKEIPKRFNDFDEAKPNIEKILNIISADKITKNDPIVINILGVCFKKSFPFIKMYIEDNCSSGKRFELRLSMLDNNSDAWETLDDRWNNYLKIFNLEIDDIVKNVMNIENSNVYIELNKYSYMPNWHGVLINDRYLFLSTCNWTDNGVLAVGESPYNLHQKNISDRHDDTILQFKRWLEFSRNRGSSRDKLIVLDQEAK